jgi:glutamate synthase domain-containing protein 2
MISSVQFQKKQLAAAFPVVPLKQENGTESLVIDRFSDGADSNDMPLVILDPKKFEQVKSGDKVITDQDKGVELEMKFTIGGKGHGSISSKASVSLDRYAEMAGFREHHGAIAGDSNGLWFVAYK